MTKLYKVVVRECGSIIRDGSTTDTAMCPESFDNNGPGRLGDYLSPKPPRGLVAKTLKQHMFTANAEGRPALNGEGKKYGSGPPSRVLWKLAVLPDLVRLLREESGSEYVIDSRALGVINGQYVVDVDESVLDLDYESQPLLRGFYRENA
ncbi:hypothetical protein [Marinagarivorans cellulosilyticus]|uniref:Uncharacterized protein n=1 Tax=Marinagarivorans cellulosilyticus TaxID=2721545 RepID=A0AAN1WHK3_9GAMM|nr:hypothetical protein [Marinagarivorans cellulosilyticus]BCD97738.1 hypothetical protein MARGE09_P1939 [Marinagarivorans cellulosilyticus]